MVETVSDKSMSQDKTLEHKFAKEESAFWAMHKELLKTHLSKFVAIHEGKVVDSDYDRILLTKRVYDKYGYIPIYFQQIIPEGLRTFTVNLYEKGGKSCYE